MSKKIITSISPALVEFLEQKDFKVREDSLPSAAFGDLCLVFSSNDFCIRLTRDRGDIFLELSSAIKPLAWHRLEIILAFLNGMVDANSLPKLKIDAAIKALIENYNGIAQLLNSDLERVGFLRYKQKQADILFRDIFGY